ncbi:hypothetical protein AURDEDRAFT_172682 [Auricularia subglabra TFB-10046 SS5]|nr:hypothetical protein AURDEDRAFT_172682 [Auricularia subglabra TFB-10046 SS5]
MSTVAIHSSTPACYEDLAFDDVAGTSPTPPPTFPVLTSLQTVHAHVVRPLPSSGDHQWVYTLVMQEVVRLLNSGEVITSWNAKDAARTNPLKTGRGANVFTTFRTAIRLALLSMRIPLSILHPEFPWLESHYSTLAADLWPVARKIDAIFRPCKAIAGEHVVTRKARYLKQKCI